MAADLAKKKRKAAAGTSTASLKKRNRKGLPFFDIENPPPWSDLPSDIVRFIFGRISMADCVRARAVCKNWLLPPDELQIQSTTRELPWIMMHEWKETKEASVVSVCKLYDPFYKKQKPYIVEEHIKSPKEMKYSFFGVKICASKHGWVMFFKEFRFYSFTYFFLYNPFTKDIIILPEYLSTTRIKIATFSSSPSSPNCVFFVLTQNQADDTIIQTCHHGDRTWTKHEFAHDKIRHYQTYDDAAYIDGSFYCVTGWGTLAAFSVASQDWKVLTELYPFKTYQGKPHLVESDGEILLVFRHSNLFLFDKSSRTWVSKERLQDRALFLGHTSYLVPADGEAKNKIYYHKGFRSHYTQLISSSDNRIQECTGNEVYGWVPYDKRIWVEPPNFMQ